MIGGINLFSFTSQYYRLVFGSQPFLALFHLDINENIITIGSLDEKHNENYYRA